MRDDGLKPLLLKPAEATKLLGVSRSKLYEMVRDGAIATVMIGPRQRRYPYAECEAYVARLIAEQTAPGTPDEPPATEVA